MAWFGFTFGKKAHYSGDVSENAIFWLPTQDSGNRVFSTKGLIICAPLIQCSYKKLSGNFVSCLSSSPTRVNCQLSQDCDSKAEAIEPQRAPSRGRLEKQAVCGSFSALFARRFAVLARPLSAVFRITDILYGPPPLAGGRSDALLHLCLLSSLKRAWDPLPVKQGYLQTLEIDTKYPIPVFPLGKDSVL